MAKKKTVARKGRSKGKREEFVAKCPPGLTAQERAAWEAAAESSGGQWWSPAKQGDYVKGHLLSRQTESSKYGERTVLQIDTGEGVLSVGCTTILEKEVQSKDPQVGDHILILYKGLWKGGKGRPAKLFALSFVGDRKGTRVKGVARKAKRR